MQTPICCHTNYLYTFQTIQRKYAKIEHAFLPIVKTHTYIVLSLKRLFIKNNLCDYISISQKLQKHNTEIGISSKCKNKNYRFC